MGFITLDNGETVHTSFLIPNHIKSIYNGIEWVENGVFYSEQITEFESGERQIAILSHIVDWIDNRYNIPYAGIGQ